MLPNDVDVVQPARRLDQVDRPITYDLIGYGNVSGGREVCSWLLHK